MKIIGAVFALSISQNFSVSFVSSAYAEILSIAENINKIRKIIVINHKDCGAAKIVNGKKKFNSIIENKIHRESFKKIKKILNNRFPSLKISFKILSLKD